MRNDALTDPNAAGLEQNSGLFRTIQGRHGRLAFFANDTGAVSRSLDQYGEWAENEIGFLRQFVPPGSVVLDVGAYVGSHTLAFARSVGADGQVIAFEAQPETYRLLERNVADNQLTNVLLQNMAVGDSVGTLDIPLIDVESSESFGSASLRNQMLATASVSGQFATEDAAFARVPMGTIDALQLERCALIKIDTEGTESAVIRGAAATIARLSPVIYAECNSIADGLLSLAELAKLDYMVRLHVVDAFAADNFFGAGENIFGSGREAALVAVHRSQSSRLDAIESRECELLLRLETSDDLAVGLLNKPQYIPEILLSSAAAASGGAAWITEVSDSKTARERAENEASWAKATLAEARERLVETEKLQQELTSARATVADLSGQLRQLHLEVGNQLVLAEAAMRQAQAARRDADESRHAAAIAERVKEEAVAARADATQHAGALAERLRGTETVLNAVYGSTSWQLTRPLRWGVERLRRRGTKASAR